MDALIASYGDASSDDSDTDTPNPPPPQTSNSQASSTTLLPPPPLFLLEPPNSLGNMESLQIGQAARVRTFPHVEGNYALHVYIPVYIPSTPKKDLALFLKKVTSLLPSLHVVDVDVPLNSLCKDDQKLAQVALGREFHISLGRTVPIRVHQIDSVVAMLRQKLQFQRRSDDLFSYMNFTVVVKLDITSFHINTIFLGGRYLIDFSKWEVFVNDDHTRTFLSMEIITGGLAEITKQIEVVNEVYRLHNLPEFYKDPRPHISLAWALGDISDSLKRIVEEEMKRVNVRGSLQKCIFTSKFSGIECKIGQKTYKICKVQDD